MTSSNHISVISMVPEGNDGCNSDHHRTKFATLTQMCSQKFQGIFTYVVAVMWPLSALEDQQLWHWFLFVYNFASKFPVLHESDMKILQVCSNYNRSSSCWYHDSGCQVITCWLVCLNEEWGYPGPLGYFLSLSVTTLNKSTLLACGTQRWHWVTHFWIFSNN